MLARVNFLLGVAKWTWDVTIFTNEWMHTNYYSL